MASKPDILIVSSDDWDDLWYQRQEFASRFARAGHRVFYLNKTLQRRPRLHHFKKRFMTPQRHKTRKNPRPASLRVVTPVWLPPVQCLRRLNRVLIRRTLKPLGVRSPVLIAAVPTWNTIDLIDLVGPSKVVYLNVHNYDDDERILRQLLESEKVLVERADLLFADAAHNARRLARISGGRVVHRAPPGVDYEEFRTAFRGDETDRRRTLYYFGGIGPHLDLSVYGALADRMKVVFVGVVDPAVRNRIPEGIEVRPPVSNSELPDALRDADVLAISYRDSPYIRGVIPAKLFECMATGKPILVSGLPETLAYEDAIYNFDGSQEQAGRIIEGLPQTETPQRLTRRDELAKVADWSGRFKAFADIVLGSGK